ncbi:MAG: hypothetical protein KAX44_02100, partial [Candidatus Brocadiae bacterium]|nr:hypothetical protein [Candidatus Brocadiia bacterium]
FALFCLCGAQGRPGVFFASSALVAAAGCVGLWRVRPGQRREVMASAVLVALGVALCVAFLGWGDAVRWGTVRARWRTFSRFRLETVSDTRYQHVELGEREGERVLVQNGYLTAQFPNPRAASAQAALLLTQHPRPRDVLVVGGGLGGLCQELLKGPIAALDYVDADPQLMCLLYDNLPADLQKPLSDPRFAAYSRDGRYFVQRAAKRPGALARAHIPLGRAAAGQVEVRRPVGAYDLVILALGDPASASASRFYTVEFCRELLGILRPGGAVAFCGITSSENYVRGTAVLNYTGCIYKTLRSVFDRVVVRPGDEFCFFASAVEGVVSADTELLVGRFDALGLEPEALKYNLELAEFPPERVLSVSRLLEEARPTALLSSDARPVVFTLFLALQAHFARPEPGGQAGVRDLFGLVRSIRTVWLWLPFLVFLVPVILLRVRFGSERAAPWACGFSIFTSGVFGLSAELLIVYAYQTSFGYVYRDISIIVGLFMLGLALGGWLAGRWWPGRARGSLLVVECMQAVFVLALPMLARGLSFSPFAFMLLAGAAGFLTGSEFPLASRISLLSGREAGTVAGIFDAADHLGALAGAAWAGLLLVPSLGVIQSAALLALVKCVSLVALVLAFVRTRRSARTSVS